MAEAVVWVPVPWNRLNRNTSSSAMTIQSAEISQIVQGPSFSHAGARGHGATRQTSRPLIR